MWLRLAVVLLLAPSIHSLEAGADVQARTPGSTDEVFRPLVTPVLDVLPAAGPIVVDGVIDEPAWERAAVTDAFTEVDPGNQVQPPVRTEARISYDDRHLYIAFRAFDDPSRIRASLRKRDEMFDDDWVGILLDTFGDASNAYELFVNPLGVQGDLMRMANDDEDAGFDMIFRSEGRITEEGYEVEMAIPFSSLRFPNRPEQAWRATFVRNHPREVRRIYSWATVDNDLACLMCQLGTFRVTVDANAGSRLQIMPAVVGYQSRVLVDEDDLAAGHENHRFRPEASLNVRYDLTSSLAAEATFNPDFSQIESDAAQIDVNSTFALFYPERRPFFQEGSDLFSSQIDVIYTRSINNPIGAAKLIGRSGRTTLAYLSAVDEDTPILLPFEERSELVEGGRSVSNILRMRHTVGRNSYVGGTITDRRLLDGGSGSLASADFQVGFLKRYSISTQLAVSSTAEPRGGYEPEEDESAMIGGNRYTAALDGERFAGHGLKVELDRAARHWAFELVYEGLSPTFRTANGFVTRNDIHRMSMFQRYAFYPNRGFASVITPFLNVERQLNFRGERKLEMIRPALNLQMKGQTYAHLSYRISRERFRGFEFDGLRAWAVNASTAFTNALGAGFYFNGGIGIARNEDVPEHGRFREAGAFLDLKPTPRLRLRPSIDYARMRRPDSDHTFFDGWIVRGLLSYQFNREFSVRLFSQYNDFNQHFSLEPLLAYQLSPFTVLYVGSTHDYGTYDEPYGFMEARRQFFFKVQYLFQR